jgi:hypothetical protein
MRDLAVSIALGYCAEPMCQGTLDHPGDHYVQRFINGKTITTFWPRAEHRELTTNEINKIIRRIEEGWRE